MNFKQLLATALFVSTIAVSTQVMNAQEIKLPTPSFTGGMPVNEAVANRHSCREFDSSRNVDNSVLSQLLWMSLGINRPDAPASKYGVKADRSNPTALNRQEITAYVFGKDAVYEYLPASHSLKLVKTGDYRALVAGGAGFSQDFVLDAPISIVFVADVAKLPEGDNSKNTAMVDAGIACENLNIACASLGIATVPRASMDAAGISALLGLTDLQIPVMNNPIGYQK